MKKLIAQSIIIVLQILFILSVSTCTKTEAPRITTNQKPTWITSQPQGQFKGQASYSIQSVKQAEEEALANAVSSMLRSKVGNTADIKGELQNDLASIRNNAGESIFNTASINTTVTISGEEIPTQYRTVETWQDRDAGIVHVLIEDLSE